jgi:phosphatidate cytidylyltransferase
MGLLNPPSRPFLLALGGVFALLAAASASVALWGRVRPRADLAEVRLRIRSWWGMVGAMGGALALGPLAATALLALVSAAAWREFCALLPARASDRLAVAALYACIPVQYACAVTGAPAAFALFLPVGILLALSAGLTLAGNTRGFTAAVGGLVWGQLMTVFLLSHAARLLWVRALPGHPDAGRCLAFILLGLTELNDVAQFLWGRALGRRPVLPSVSPRKTWAGLLGGLGTTLALAVLLGPALTPLTRGQSAWAGLLIGVGGFLGDVVMSAVKRDAGVQASGRALPGHGGVLDRVDSLIFTAPLFFYFLQLAGVT